MTNKILHTFYLETHWKKCKDLLSAVDEAATLSNVIPFPQRGVDFEGRALELIARIGGAALRLETKLRDPAFSARNRATFRLFYNCLANLHEAIEIVESRYGRIFGALEDGGTAQIETSFAALSLIRRDMRLIIDHFFVSDLARALNRIEVVTQSSSIRRRSERWHP